MAGKYRTINEIAAAAIATAAANSKVPELLQGLRTINAVLDQKAELVNFLADKDIALDDRMKILKEALLAASGNYAINTFFLLMENDVLDERDMLYETAEEEGRSQAGYYYCKVTSAIELDEKQKTDLLKSLSTKLNGQVEADFIVDKNLIGGVEISCGDWHYLGSIRAKLEKLTKHLIQA